jgi:hypothetical protein
MTNIRNALMQAAGSSASSDPVYVEDVFSTHLYTGNDSSQTITNGLDLSGEGGLVWTKDRGNAESHTLLDTERGATKILSSNATDLEMTIDGGFDAFTSTGFTLKADNGWNINKASRNYSSWSFRKQKGFFDVVKFSTTGGGGTQAISHSLGSIPGFIILKKTSASQSWLIFHKGVTSPNSNWWRNWSDLTTAAFDDYFSDDSAINSAPTSTTVTVGSYFTDQTADFIMYVFAEGGSGDQIFGEDGDEAIIKTGTFTTDASGVIATDVDLGFELQWLLVKRTDSTGPLNLFDTMRGFHGEKRGENRYVRPNTNGAEATNASADAEFITTTGFGSHGNGVTGSANGTFMYIAIRRGPMKEPSAGTDVFKAVNSDSDGAFQTGFPVDCYINLFTSTTYNNYWAFRKLFHWTLVTDLSDASQGYDASGLEKGWGSSTYYARFDKQNAVGHSFTGNYTAFCWRRYPKVFDIVQYKAAGAGTHTHSLKVVPEMILLTCISHPNRNVVYHKAMGNTKQLHMDEDIAETTGRFNDTTPTASVFSVSDNTQTGTSGRRYIAMLFASFSGICDVGSYTGTGNDLNVTGLGAAARWVMIKRTDATGDWFVYDTTRGIVAGNDPYHFLNTSSADVTNTDYIDPHSSGFTITSSAPNGLNASGGTYIYLAYA